MTQWPYVRFLEYVDERGKIPCQASKDWLGERTRTSSRAMAFYSSCSANNSSWCCLVVTFLAVVFRTSVNVSLVSDTKTSGFGAGASAWLWGVFRRVCNANYQLIWFLLANYQLQYLLPSLLTLQQALLQTYKHHKHVELLLSDVIVTLSSSILH